MKQPAARLASVQDDNPGATLHVVHTRAEAKSAPHTRPAVPNRAGQNGEGIEVQEQELGHITAQRMYRIRCECGRPWFELELPRLVKCPKCHRLNLVTL